MKKLEIDGKKVGFISDGNVFLERCPKCDKENWTMAVAKGQCAWCGFDANKKVN